MRTTITPVPESPVAAARRKAALWGGFAAELIHDRLWYVRTFGVPPAHDGWNLGVDHMVRGYVRTAVRYARTALA